MLDRFKEPPPNGVENIGRKILRHLATGQLDRTTILNGIRHIRMYLEANNFQGSTVELNFESEDYCGHDGLKFTTYELRRGERALTQYEAIAFLDFPLNSKIRVENYRSMMDKREDLGICENDPDIIASFIGPTSLAGIPNNGYYTRSHNVLRAFQDTDPPGQRRGAIATNETGKVSLLTDAEKWDAVNNEYRSLEALIGTSYYFTSEDRGDESGLFSDIDASNVSYLIRYADERGFIRFCYCNINILVPRLFAHFLIRNHMQKVRAKSFMAVELEYLRGGCSIRMGKGKYAWKTVGNPGSIHYDYYHVKQKKAEKE